VQLMIDTLAETPDALDLAARFFAEHAALRRAMEAGAGLPNVPTGTSADALVRRAGLDPSGPSAPFVPPAPPSPGETVTVLGENGNVVAQTPPPPAPPSPMSAPAAVTPATPAPPSPSSAAPVSPGASVAPPVADEYDRAGVPWDVRIHQDGKSQKKDGTWKLRKKIDPALVESVMRELAPRVRKPTAPSAPEAPPAPSQVSLPPDGAVAPPPPPPVPQAPAGETVAAPPPPPPPAIVPPAPGGEAQGQTVDPFRALVAKITKARAEKKLSPEEVTAAVTGAGVASLQLLNAMPHKVAEVEANIDAILVTR